MRRIPVAPTLAGRRLDAAVAAGVPGLTVHGARRLIADGRVRVDGRVLPKGHRVEPGQILEVDDDAGEAADGAAVGAGAGGGGVRADPTLVLRVLHADDALVAVAKPAGIPSHPLRPGELGTVANAIVARFPECATASPDRREGGLAHRLDRETSGVLLAARSPEAWRLLRAALRDDACTKTYLAEVVGEPPEHGQQDAPIGRTGRRGARVRVGGGRNPLPARTEWHVVAQRAGTALVRAELHAGRAHQVRAHLAAAGFPVLGDSRYGDAAAQAAAAARAVAGLRLHAAAVAFRHPVTGAAILIEAPPPDWAIIR